MLSKSLLTRAIIEYLNTNSDQLYDGRAIKSSIHHPIFKRKLVDLQDNDADVIDAAEFLLGPAEPPEDRAALATWNRKKVNLRFQLL